VTAESVAGKAHDSSNDRKFSLKGAASAARRVSVFVAEATAAAAPEQDEHATTAVSAADALAACCEKIESVVKAAVNEVRHSPNQRPYLARAHGPSFDAVCRSCSSRSSTSSMPD
jgi:hypothetical protein